MIIRSQDKMQLIPFEGFVFTATKAGLIVCDKDTLTKPSELALRVIAGYSTNEKAIKVLDEICTQYGRYTCRYGGDHSIDAVYQMPQDSEVE